MTVPTEAVEAVWAWYEQCRGGAGVDGAEEARDGAAAPATPAPRAVEALSGAAWRKVVTALLAGGRLSRDLMDWLLAPGTFPDPGRREGACTVVVERALHLEAVRASSQQPAAADAALTSILQQLEYLPSRLAYRICNGLLHALPQAEGGMAPELLAFLPKCLAIIARCEKVQVVEHGDPGPGASAARYFLSGSQWKEHSLGRLCAGRWWPRNVLALVAALRECELSEAQLDVVASKALAQLGTVPPTEAGLLVHQLLLLSRSGASVRRRILAGICEHGRALMAVGASGGPAYHAPGTFAQAEAILLQFNLALKQDQELGLEFLAHVKAGPAHLHAFTLSVCLLMLLVQRYADKGQDVLRGVLAASAQQSPYYSAPWLHAYGERFRPVNLQELLLRLIPLPWTMDQVMAGALGFAMALLRTGAGTISHGSSGSSSGGSGTGAGPRGRPSSKQDQASRDASALGTEVCLALFEAQPSAQRTILQELLGEMDSCTCVPAIYDLFCRLARRHPTKLLPFLPRLRNLLYTLPSLPEGVVEAFLRVLVPLLEHDGALRDTLFITLRKSLFSKDAKARMMALSGYLAILSSAPANLPMASGSQAPPSSRGPPRPAAGLEAYEVLGNLKRCLTQQQEIRLQVYTGLGAFLRQSPEFAGDVFEILHPQFLKYYERDHTRAAPLLLAACLDTGHQHVRLGEPLPALLAALCQTLLLLLRPEQEERGPRYLACQDLLNTLSRRLLKADLEDFELDKGGDWSPASHAGSRNLLKARLLVGCYEVLLAYSYTSGPRPPDAETWQLTQRFHRRIEDLAFLKPPVADSVLELGFLAACCQDFHASANVDSDFQAYLIRMLHRQVSAMQGREPPLPELLATGQACMAILRQGPGSIKRRQDLFLVCEAFERAIVLVPEAVGRVELLARLWDVDQAGVPAHQGDCAPQPSVVTLAVVQGLLQFARSLLPEHGREAAVFLRVAHAIPASDQGTDSPLIAFVEGLLRTQPALEDPAFLKLATQLWLEDAKRRSRYATWSLVAREVQCIFDLIDPAAAKEGGGEVSLEPCLQASSLKSGPVLATCLLSVLDGELDEMDWAWRKGGPVSTASGPSKGTNKSAKSKAEDQEQDPFEEDLTTRLVHVLEVVLAVERACLPDVAVEPLLRLLSKGYKLLTHLTKRRLKTLDVTTPFLRLAEGACLLTNSVYTLIHFLQQRDTENAPRRKSLKSKISREGKSIPNLIYHMEIFERYLLQLNAKVDRNLLRYMKRSTTRDFRIQVQELKQNQPKKHKGADLA